MRRALGILVRSSSSETATRGSLAPEGEVRPRLWALMNLPQPVDPRAMRVACTVLLVTYATIALVRYETGKGEFLMLRLAVCGYAVLGILLSRRVTWYLLRGYTAILALLLPLQAAYIDGMLGNHLSELAISALATFVPLVFLQTAFDFVVVDLALVIGHALVLWMVPEPAVPHSVVALVLGGALATGTSAGFVTLLYRVRWVHTVQQLERALAVSAEWESCYEAASLASGQILYDWTPSTHTVRYGGAYERILGYTTEEMNGGVGRWLELVHPDDRPDYRAASKRSLTAKAPYRGEYRVQRKDGTYIVVEDNGHFVLDDAGEIVRLVGFIADITERKHIEAFRAAEAETSAALARVGRELISSLETPVLLDRLCRLTTEVLGCEVSQTWLWDPGNDVYLPISGYGLPEDEWQALRLVRVPSGPSTPLIARLEAEEIVQVAAASTRHPVTASLLAHYGVSPVLCVALRRGGEIIGIQSAGYRQTSERKAQEFTPQQMRIALGIAQLASLGLANARLFEELERASRLKSEFVSTMSHELRTPLNVILGYVDMLTDGGLGDEQRRILGRIRQSGLELLEMVEATLNLNRIAAGKDLPTFEPVALDELVEELRGEYDALPRATGVRLTLEAEPGLLLETDRRKLKIVLKNLVGNALKFTSEGEIALACASDGTRCVCTVRDTGIGIAAEHLPQIFEMFRQVDSSDARRFGGAGLGLYIVKSLLAQLGGEITVESTPGRGSTFHLTLPLAAPSAARAPDDPYAPVAKWNSSRTILPSFTV
jgi:PAS domain S-box-containing protein